MKMNRALVITAWNRPEYFWDAARSWASVDMTDWDVFLRLEPSDPATEARHIRIFESLMLLRGVKPENQNVRINPERLGVLSHPWHAFSDLLIHGNYDFVVRTEDDLLVSNDVLSYFTWASEHFLDDQRVATVNAFSKGPGGDDHAVVAGQPFNPWMWGTWVDRWQDTISPTWDHDYSSGGEHDSGWDWNLETRVLPSQGLMTVQPLCSRVKNIGEHGVHGTPENLPASPSWQQFFPSGEFHAA